MLPLAIAQSASGSVGMSCTSDFVAGVMLVIAHNWPGRDSTVRYLFRVTHQGQQRTGAECDVCDCLVVDDVL